MLVLPCSSSVDLAKIEGTYIALVVKRALVIYIQWPDPDIKTPFLAGGMRTNLICISGMSARVMVRQN
jgi:hypothetical protein